MVPIYKKVLVPIDGSEVSSKAVQHAAELASVMQAEITLFHVLSPLPPGIDRESLTRYIEDVRHFGENILEEEKNKIAGYNFTVSTEITNGHPAEEICKKAKDDQFDLIFIGNRGLNPITEFLMGSVSKRVVRHAPCPVLIIR